MQNEEQLNTEASGQGVQSQSVTKPAPKKVDILAEKKKRALKETANFKKKYFDYYDDIKISAREDW